MLYRRLDSFLRQCVILGALAVVLIPEARTHSVWFGYLPLWLLGTPLVAWWSLRRVITAKAARGSAAARSRPRRAPPF